MTKEREIGVFLPIGNGGWIMSENTTLHPPQLYDYNLEAARIADRSGMDFIMSMAKWRGYPGSTDHWSQTLESLTMMCGLAQATERAQVWATVHTTVQHPAVVAKMFTTLDQISHGRSGINIVVGGQKLELEQLQSWGPQHLEHDDRYRYTAEWLDVLEGAWTGESFDYSGEFFQFDDLQLKPTPSRKPRLICAGTSPVGLDFTTSRADGAFVSFTDFDSLAATSSRVHGMAEEKGRDIKVYIMLAVVLDETDAKAEARIQHIQDGIDEGAVQAIAAAYRKHTDRPDILANADQFAERRGFQNTVLSGSPETLAERLSDLFDRTGIDGVMLTFTDYKDELAHFGEAVLPRLKAGTGAFAMGGAA